jgi:hypothetical protein
MLAQHQIDRSWTHTVHTFVDAAVAANRVADARCLTADNSLFAVRCMLALALTPPDNL